MNTDRLRPVYLGGIALNLLALAYALTAGELLFAVTFVLVLVYLVVRYRMLGER